MKTRKLVLVSILISFSWSSVAVEKNSFSENVKVYSKGNSYENDYDTSKFRLKVVNSGYQIPKADAQVRTPSSLGTLAPRLQASPSNLCQVVKQARNLDLSSSSAYVVSALKQSGAITRDDKDYSLDSAHFFWEMYLSYRNFVDISQPLKSDGNFSFSKLANGSIITLEKGCNVNGIAAIYCDGKYYAPKFVNPKNLEARVNDDNDASCQLGKGMRVIAEASRFK